MDFARLFSTGKFCLSFEVFPPKTVTGEQTLVSHVEKLVKWQPAYLTCTYGAGGSTRDKTLQLTAQLRRDFGLPVASHLTCVGSSRAELRSYLAAAAAAGIDNIVALRGDPPHGETVFRTAQDGLSYANELVELIREEFPQFGVAVGGYPETHQEAESPQADLANLKRKVDAGADVVITQLFYDNADFFQFRERCELAGIRVPIVPGILPVTNLSQIQRITQLCGAKLPHHFVQRLSEKDDEAWQYQVGVEHAVKQVQELLAGAVPGVHFYVLNKSAAANDILQALPNFMGIQHSP